jgi:acyl carrier protein
MTEPTRTRVAELLRDILGRPELTITDDTTAADVDGWDSVSHIALIFSIEDEFSIEFTSEDIAGYASVGELIRGIERLRASELS